MGRYKGAVITTVGQNLIAEALAGHGTVTFTTLVTSSHQYPDGTNLQALTSLDDVEQTVIISSATVFDDNILQVAANVGNAGVTTAYLIQTIGLYAKLNDNTPILAAVIVAINPDEMPAEDPASPSSFLYTIQMLISNADQIQVTVNPAGTVNVDQLRQYIEKAGGDAADAVIGSTAAQTADYPIPAAGDTFKVILGKIAKFFADIKQAIVGLSVSGKTVTYTRADGTTGTFTTQDTTYGVVSKTAAGLAPQLPNETTTEKYLRQDGAWIKPPNTTYGVVSKTANGLAPKLPNETTTTKYLRQDGTWVVPPNTTYGLSSTSANGLMRQLQSSNQTAYFMRGDGNWGTIQNNLNTSNGGSVLDARQGRALLQNYIKDYIIVNTVEKTGQTIAANSAVTYTVGATVNSGYFLNPDIGTSTNNPSCFVENSWYDDTVKGFKVVVSNVANTQKTGLAIYVKYSMRRGIS